MAFECEVPVRAAKTSFVEGAAKGELGFPPNPMPKKHRLSRADFARMPRGKARRVHGTYFSLSVAPLTEATAPKVACVVSKKVSPKAVVRNQVQRRCREAARMLVRDVMPCALVFTAKREAIGVSFEDLELDIRRLFERAGLRGTMRGT